MANGNTQRSPRGGRIWFDRPVTEAVLHAGKGQETKEYLQKVASLVPAEIVAAYNLVISLVTGIQPKEWQAGFYWLCFCAGVLGTAAYTNWQIGKGWEKVRHLAVYVCAFVVWAYAISGSKLLPFPYYQDAIAGIILVVVSLALGKVPLPEEPEKRR
jgi:hypothetical protein